MNSLVTTIAPAVVAVLTAAGAVIGLQFRDVDAYERRRNIWQWLLVLLAAAATLGAVGSASGVGSLIEATTKIIWTNTPDGEMRGEQPGWARFTGQSEEEYQGSGWSSRRGPRHPSSSRPRSCAPC